VNVSNTGTQPLVLVPGLLCDALMWAPQIDGLADVADCWVVDNTGHDAIGQIARAALEACPFERFSLAGLSMGGYIALEMWRQAPSRVQRLALIDTNALADSPEAMASRRVLMDKAQAEGLDKVVETLFPRLVWPQAPRARALLATIRTMARNTGTAAFLRQQMAIMQRSDRRADLPAITCPALVACGADDLLMPPALHRDMAAAIPGAVFEVFAACGHMSTMEQPEAVNQALRSWLARV
jgi:pimeloyl-ACP methyl ester carboxylesterase